MSIFFYEKLLGIPPNRKLFDIHAIAWAIFATRLLILTILYGIICIPMLLIMRYQTSLKDSIIPPFLIIIAFILINMTLFSLTPFMTDFFYSTPIFSDHTNLSNQCTTRINNKQYLTRFIVFISIAIIMFIFGILFIFRFPPDDFNFILIIFGYYLWIAPILFFGFLSFSVYKEISVTKCQSRQYAISNSEKYSHPNKGPKP